MRFYEFWFVISLAVLVRFIPSLLHSLLARSSRKGHSPTLSGKNLEYPFRDRYIPLDQNYRAVEIDISEHTENMTPARETMLREHISRAYILAESLDWCNPDDNLEVHRRSTSDKMENKESVVPVLSCKFNNHREAQSAYADLQTTTEDMSIEIYDVHYEKQARTIGVLLKPFEL